MKNDYCIVKELAEKPARWYNEERCWNCDAPTKRSKAWIRIAKRLCWALTELISRAEQGSPRTVGSTLSK